MPGHPPWSDRCSHRQHDDDQLGGQDGGHGDARYDLAREQAQSRCGVSCRPPKPGLSTPRLTRPRAPLRDTTPPVCPLTRSGHVSNASASFGNSSEAQGRDQSGLPNARTNARQSVARPCRPSTQPTRPPTIMASRAVAVHEHAVARHEGLCNHQDLENSWRTHLHWPLVFRPHHARSQAAVTSDAPLVLGALLRAVGQSPASCAPGPARREKSAPSANVASCKTGGLSPAGRGPFTASARARNLTAFGDADSVHVSLGLPVPSVPSSHPPPLTSPAAHSDWPTPGRKRRMRALQLHGGAGCGR